MENKKIDRPLLEQFIAGKCNKQDMVRINHFIQTPEGKALLEEVMEEHWKQAPQVDVSDSTLVSWKEELNARLPVQDLGLGNRLVHFGRRYIFRYAAFWAMLALGLGLYGYLSRHSEQEQKADLVTSTDALGKLSFFKLADGTRVYVAGDSKLTFPDNFIGNSREVSLDGEAYFEVKKNTEKPFIVHTGKVSTKVLGTTFKVRAYAEEALMVSVSSGKVQVAGVEGELKTPVVLTRGEELTYALDGTVLLAQVAPARIIEWKASQMLFDATPFRDLMEEVGRWYDVSIVIEQRELQQIPITVTLDPDMSLRQLLDALSTVTGCTYRLDGRQVRLTI